MDRKCNIIKENDCEIMIGKVKASLTEENLTAISNKGIYKRGTKDAESITDVSISFSDDFFSIEFDDTKTVIKKDLSDFSCSCRSKTVCRHVISALVVLRDIEISQAVQEEASSEVNPEEEVPSSEETCEEKMLVINPEYLSEVISSVRVIMKKGIINCGKSDIDVLVQLSLKGENTIHNNISLMIRSLSSYIGEMLEKSAEFSSIKTVHLLCRIYNTAKAVLANEKNPDNLEKLCYDGKEKYTERKPLCFTGLGAYPWTTDSGYAGVTAILYCNDDNRIYTYSSSISYIYENTKKFSSFESLEEVFSSHAHWTNSVSLEQVSGSVFRLIGGKTSNGGRISSSKKTTMHPLSENIYEKVPLMNIGAENFSADENEYEYFGRRQEEKIIAVRFEEFTHISYNKINQVLEFEISDGIRLYPCEISWNEHNKNAVAYIERAVKKAPEKGSFIICRYIGKVFVPVSIIDRKKVRCFYFE